MIYRRRKFDVEPVFGRMKRDFGVRRTHLRGQRAVENDVGLTLMALNLTKLGKMINQLRPLSGHRARPLGWHSRT